MDGFGGPTLDGYAGEVRGIWTRGDAPQELVLSDGTRLRLEAELPLDGEVHWRRVDERNGEASGVSTAQARELAGSDFEGFVEVRTRAEAEWLRTVAEWCGTEAERLDRELAGAPS